MFFKTKLTILSFFLLTLCLTMSADISQRAFTKYSAADGLADNSAHTIHCMSTGRIVITTMGQINFYDGHKFVFIDSKDENAYPLSYYDGHYHLYFDKYHHMWLKNHHIVTCVDLMTERFVQNVGNVFTEFGVDNEVHDLFVDHEGIVWLMTDEGMMNVKNKKIVPVSKKLNLQDLETYGDQYVMLFYENGQIDVYDYEAGSLIHESQALTPQDVPRYDKSTVLLLNGDICYQIRNGQKESVLLQFDTVKKTWEELLRTPYHLNNMTVRDSLLYLPCEYGYWTYDIKNKSTHHVEGLRMETGHDLYTCLNVMAFDLQGGLWVGTERTGLLYARPFNAPFASYPWDDKRAVDYAAHLIDLKESVMFKGKWVNCVFKDSRGWTWVGTSQGLQYYKKSSDHLPQILTTKDGLLNSVIHSVVEDHHHNIWLSTSYGITCLVMDGEKIHYVNSYNRYDNVPSESFVNGKAACLSDGTIVMQAIDHVVTFNPDKMKTLTGGFQFEIYPKLIRLQVNGNEIMTGVELDGEVILDHALIETQEINLNYKQNSLSLVFSAHNFFRPSQTCYRVRVKGLDNDWHVYNTYNSGGLVDSRGLLHLPLISLRPGTYVVEVQASMVPDRWDSKAQEWIVNIREPWWRTSGIFALYGFLLIVLLGINVFYYLRNANMRAMRDSEEISLLKRLSIFAKRCTEMGEAVEPLQEEVYGQVSDPQNELTPEFINAMLKIMPMVQGQKPSQLSMRQLSEAAGIDVQQFYSLISSNIYKSPRLLMLTMMIRKAEDLLRNTQMPIGMIAEKCGFATPNFFIATFYHMHQKTPKEYRGML